MTGAASRHDDRGVGAVTTVVGVTVFLAMMLLAAQILLNLYATSVVTSAAFDAARVTAAGGTERAGEARARELLGRRGESALVEVSRRNGVVTARLRVDNPALIPGLARRLALARVDRTVTMRAEAVGEPPP